MYCDDLCDKTEIKVENKNKYGSQFQFLRKALTEDDSSGNMLTYLYNYLLIIHHFDRLTHRFDKLFIKGNILQRSLGQKYPPLLENQI